MVTAVAVGLLVASVEMAGAAGMGGVVPAAGLAAVGMAAGGCDGPTTTIGAMPSSVCRDLARGVAADAAAATGGLAAMGAAATGAVGALGCTAGSGTV